MTSTSAAGPRPAGAHDGPATTAARVLVQALAALGVRDAVLAPGSRSAPLAYALADAARPDGQRPAGAPSIRLHVRTDERSAGFLALGLAKAAEAIGERRPVVVVTTSGTAVANLHPAVLEAHHAGLPLVLLTADRPHELRGTGANQTTAQVGIFGAAVRLTADVPAPVGRSGEDRDLRNLLSRAMAAALGARSADPGPVHLDLAFREPLAPASSGWPEPSSDGITRVEARAAEHAAPATSPVDGPFAALAEPFLAGEPALAARRAADAPTVVVAGDGAGPVAREVAEANGWPLLAEPSSGALGSANGVPAHRLLLAHPALGGAVRRAVVLGRPTLTRPVQALLGRDDVEVVVIAPTGRDWPDAMRGASEVLTAVPARMRAGADPDGGPPGWLAAWQAAGKAALAAIDDVLDAPAPPSRSGTRVSGPTLAREVARATHGDDVLVVGSSNPVRDLDLVAAWDGPRMVLANRGLAGIDGLVSTALGVALALPHRRVRALFGDLTFLHDVGGLLRGPFEPPVDLQIVVANDDGGSIFSTLEHGAPEHADAFERVFGTPHGADLSALCAGYGVRHTRVSDVDGLAPALAAPGPGVSVVEVRVDRAGRRALMARLGAAADEAVSRTLA
ncbi:2-succinyl-5-enolpyruvyl-6-hydroxy-3-cyclohexene-1-carboxylic-acid synthase [Cellulomonas chengniuliangii]|uniref:2-succinyl-5-enolpyruvyl-6-hydroxy-3-cyclohexene-1-carboxylate synthase n=1 Tax=Cellulomonas chengniuliangii TaxID=2968084 RepID=A0ABY5KYJ0_9CELL|nr:2-succinyl-5-enolpyruvyl-6-hydroxy-3-cyclohexene-1-carboxylic-acid synthase [Cellulomonas chengniuliangii]MCC2309552.1 2-succinyl-5-enolpyruvyl-6-hydroxy-3-cyclohexene-1-carboxylic-acid synthase [Cellulomonas chengniuliangii]MCC2316823.1 2-succinyl-5-enolpyruvyl-6-hydroxy-3-cyclohexene-1-carboxylic-acid synthase [Cellulomonas chengniuliangii]UUI74893.1 2-succinyl-5-enolpyruvyl-6-hydroxy-3-cyclohexene-1-carboxylic-acid synthase [Cellulomonas chengniuliangii]